MTQPAENPKDSEKSNSTDSPAGRRSFMKIALAISLLAAIGGISSIARAISAPAQLEVSPESSSSTETSNTQSQTATASATGTASTVTGLDGFPVAMIATVSSLQVNQPVYFNYPLDDEPSILVMLGSSVTDGAGPNNDIIAFSQVCQHLGCIYAFLPPGGSPKCNSSYKASEPLGYCCCHGSVYDFANDAAVISGPAPRPVPRVVLDVDASGNIYAVGMSGANIYGHPNGDLVD
jgi:arsenite oxidase small subunit